MVTAKAAARRWTLPCFVLCCVCCGAGLLGLALPGVAGAADPYEPTWEGASEPPIPAEAACPAGPAPISEAEESELEPAERSSRAARLEAAEACGRGEELDVELAHRLWWVVTELAALNDRLVVLDGRFAEGGAVRLQLEAIEKSLVDPGGQKVQLLGYPKPLEVQSAAGGLELDGDQLDVSDEAVLTAVREGTETGNQNLWGIAGLLGGVVLLVVLWRMVRP